MDDFEYMINLRKYSDIITAVSDADPTNTLETKIFKFHSEQYTNTSKHFMSLPGNCAKILPNVLISPSVNYVSNIMVALV